MDELDDDDEENDVLPPVGCIVVVKLPFCDEVSEYVVGMTRGDDKFVCK